MASDSGLGGLRVLVLAGFIEEYFSIQSLDANRAVRSDESVVCFATVFPYRRMIRVFDERICLWRIHATIGSPVFRPVWNTGEFIFDSVEGLRQQKDGFISRRRWGGGKQAFKKDLEPLSFRWHAAILGNFVSE